MRILVANPNTSSGVTDLLVASGRLVASPGTELLPMTAMRGVPLITSAAEAAIGAGVLVEMLAERRDNVDAAIVGAFADPGLAEARELCDVPVVGMAEAAMLVSCSLGRSFAIVSFSRPLEPLFAELVTRYGLGGRCAGVRTLDEDFKSDLRSMDDLQHNMEAALVDLANRAVTDDRADVVILAGAPLAGLAGKVCDRVPVPLVDGIQAAVAMAEGLVRMNRPRRRAYSPARNGNSV